MAVNLGKLDGVAWWHGPSSFSNFTACAILHRRLVVLQNDICTSSWFKAQAPSASKMSTINTIDRSRTGAVCASRRAVELAVTVAPGLNRASPAFAQSWYEGGLEQYGTAPQLDCG